jgi:mannose-6-phosphate isomerase-like protein (cupin superfamily)
MSTINKKNASHYVWGNGCDGWHYLNQSHLSIISERMPAGISESLHYHEKAHQFFFIIKGNAVMEIDKIKYSLAEGEGIEVLPGVIHKITNVGEEGLEFLVISSPTTQGDRVNVGSI